jgi:uncharacterized membrane protein
LAGGLFVGLIGALTLFLEQPCHGFGYELVILGGFAGLGGSLIDSLLGATLQESLYSEDKKIILNARIPDQNITVISGYPVLDNHQVNFITSITTSVLCGLTAWCLYPTA